MSRKIGHEYSLEILNCLTTQQSHKGCLTGKHRTASISKLVQFGLQLILLTHILLLT